MTNGVYPKFQRRRNNIRGIRGRIADSRGPVTTWSGTP